MARHRSFDALRQWLAALLPRRSARRQTRLYCIGAPRSGTHSIAAIFDRSIRSCHEPGFRSATAMVLAHHRGEVSFDGLRAFVRRRDERLRLDVDSSHVNVFLAEVLLAEFADARFLLTIRDCFSWLDSVINHTTNTRSWSPADRRYLEFYFDAKNVTYSPHDRLLESLGLLSIDCYLAAWSRHNDRALTAVPEERLLVVRTDAISERLHEIAAFAHVAADRIDPGFRAGGAAKVRHAILDRVDPAYLEDRVAERCGALMGRFFPDIRSLRDAPVKERSRQ